LLHSKLSEDTDLVCNLTSEQLMAGILLRITDFGRAALFAKHTVLKLQADSMILLAQRALSHPRRSLNLARFVWPFY